MDLTQSGFFGNLAVSGPALLGALFGGVFSDYVGASRPKRRMLLLLGFYALAIPWPLTFSASTVVAAVLGSAFMFQLCRGLGELNSHPLIFELVSPEKRSTAIGLSNCFNTTLAGVGTLLVGVLKSELGFQTAFGLVSVVITLPVLGLLVVYFTTLERDLKRRALLNKLPVADEKSEETSRTEATDALRAGAPPTTASPQPSSEQFRPDRGPDSI
jgi:MFS-type transporter involved in bile tolerance (Atg22 family)